MTEVRHIIARILTHHYGLLILRCGDRDAGGKSLTAGQRLFPPEKAGFLSCSVMCSGMIACACSNDNLCLSLSLLVCLCYRIIQHVQRLCSWIYQRDLALEMYLLLLLLLCSAFAFSSLLVDNTVTVLC